MALITIRLQGGKRTRIKFNKYNLLVKRRVQRALEASARRIEATAKELVPVDTGRLRASLAIDPSIDRLTWRVGTNVEYSVNVEFGLGQREQPYLRPAFLLESAQLAGKLRRAIKGARV